MSATVNASSLRDKIRASDLTYKEIGKKIDRSPSAVWKAVHGEDPLGIMNGEDLRQKIADVLT